MRDASYRDLLACYRSGRMDPARLHGHMADVPDFAAFVETDVAARRDRETRAPAADLIEPV